MASGGDDGRDLSLPGPSWVKKSADDSVDTAESASSGDAAPTELSESASEERFSVSSGSQRSACLAAVDMWAEEAASFVPSTADSGALPGEHGPSSPGTTSANALLAFARYLRREAPSYFPSANDVEQRVRSFEDVFRSESGEELTRQCSHGEREPCWVLKHQKSWNNLLNSHGLELLECLRGRALSLRTLDMMERINLSPSVTLTSLCLVMWVIYEHRCIRSATLNAGIVAPHHISIFYKLLRFHTDYVSAGIVAHHSEPTGAWRSQIFDSLKYTTLLHTFHMSALRLNEPQSDNFRQLITRNPGLRSLVAVNVTVDSIAAMNLFDGLTYLQNLEELDLYARVDEGEYIYGEAISMLLHTTVQRMRLNLDCDMTQFFAELQDNRSLNELELGNPVSDAEPLLALADSLAKNRTLRCLKMAINVSRRRRFGAYGKALASIVANNRRIEVLDLSGSTLDDNASLREVCFGAVNDTPGERLQVLNIIAAKSLQNRVTFVWRDDEVPLLGNNLEAPLRKLYLQAVDAWQDDVGTFLRHLPKYESTLTTLYICAPDIITAEGARDLSSFFANATMLSKVALIYETTKESSFTLLEGIGDSSSITVLVIGRWFLDGDVAWALRDALDVNTSLLRLEVYRYDGECVCPTFDRLFPEAVTASRSLVVVQRFHFGQETRAETRDAGVRFTLRRNEMALRDTLDSILEGKLKATASFAYHMLRASSDPQGSYFREHEIGWRPLVTNRLLEVYEAVRDPLRRLSLEYDSVAGSQRRQSLLPEFQALYGKCLQSVNLRLGLDDGFSET
ncbi:hypothetical protein HPB48_023368 [Haemaphysalis longicornis]|uniref:Uncharacterized protein n=1 Tax=Haemaphysalis longicornis TaxID=44386 RepID=A0A9J6H526_HAELO|nr:hypothetical protein HPB48_023368 [Haemaphysalis longicornis]